MLQALGAATLRALLAPFLAALQLGGEQALINRVREGVVQPLVGEAEGAGQWA